MACDRIILNHMGKCAERNGEDVRIKICLRVLSSEERIGIQRGKRRRDYKPPYYLKERYECPYGQSGVCGTVKEDRNACPLYQAYSYNAYVE